MTALYGLTPRYANKLNLCNVKLSRRMPPSQDHLRALLKDDLLNSLCREYSVPGCLKSLLDIKGLWYGILNVWKTVQRSQYPKKRWNEDPLDGQFEQLPTASG